MSSDEHLNQFVEIDFGVDGRLMDRVATLAQRRRVERGDYLRHAVALLIVLDAHRDMDQQLASSLGGRVVVTGIDTSSIGLTYSSHRESLTELESLVEMEKTSYDAIDVRQKVFVSEESSMRLNAYAFSQGYDSLDPAFRDALLLFCNLQEILEHMNE